MSFIYIILNNISAQCRYHSHRIMLFFMSTNLRKPKKNRCQYLDSDEKLDPSFSRNRIGDLRWRYVRRQEERWKLWQSLIKKSDHTACSTHRHSLHLQILKKWKHVLRCNQMHEKMHLSVLMNQRICDFENSRF